MSADAFSFTGDISREVFCPTSGDVCPAREEIVRLYSEDMGTELELPHEVRPALDGMKMHTKLAELSTRAVVSGCEGVINEQCSVRMQMDTSKTRKGAVTLLRKLMGHN